MIDSWNASKMGWTVFLTTITLLLTPIAAIPTNIRSLDIYTGPAPSPEDGPSLSAGALRDKSKLKYEIIGIVGAYLFWSFLTLLFIVFVGKRLRREAQTTNMTLSMEMIKPLIPVNQQRVECAPGPRSPGKMASLRSWASGGKGHSHKHSNMSVSTVDEKTVQNDKVRNLDEMTKLYAAVMAHDEEKSFKARSSIHVSPQSPTYPTNPVHLHYTARREQTPPHSPQYPPELQHLRNTSHLPQTYSQHSDYPVPPMPEDDISRSEDPSRTSSHQVKASPLSFVSTNHHRRTSSGNSTKHRPARISVRDLPISKPIGSADLRESAVYVDEPALSPRLYYPGPPPPPPPPPSQSVADAYQTRERERDHIYRHTPGNLSLGSNATSNYSNGSLPFRQLYQESMKSAPPTKTTFLDRKEIFAAHPKTGLPSTPYSPYMPFTPMTPITPRRLVTKEEIKRNKKKDNMKVLSEDDMVMSDEDMWGEMK